MVLQKKPVIFRNDRNKDGMKFVHVQATCNPGSLERLGRAILRFPVRTSCFYKPPSSVVANLGAQVHQARHLILGNFDLLTTERGERDVCDFEDHF